ncbi:TetR/AcrR family transcriptional regulator [Phreatobacter cathodiphilus]|uniref:TetR/AcrR family transcriptional regulator n=1 Tax=Phreatobacter cathodiphilus TaxID=1868589 RepID=A0A2S0NBT7_9HYPH|nr:TetR/AcrR family transcriptional regulator [Phreatobacter cathodiphilus]AVO45622.1 TetR/AcrR family transcriptional regulator [Phreatobacter cathodiphilus]
MAVRAAGTSKPTAKEDILDAAEAVFAARGFEGASMRAIAEAAGVAQALLHYHYKTKEGLFEAMFTRRSGAINRIRLARLDVMLARGQPSVEDIVEALLRPTIEAGHDPRRGGSRFAGLILATGTAEDDWRRDLVARSYDPMAGRFIAALTAALPGLDRAAATWGYLFVVGAALTQMAPTGRADRLSGGEARDEDTDAMLARAVVFAAAGLRALAAAGPDVH